MWLRTFFMVRQWGRLHCRTSPLACSRRWHLCAWSRRTSCCWISLRFSGSAVGGAPAAADAAETWAPGPTRPAWALGSIPGAPPTGAPEGPPTPVCDCWEPCMALSRLSITTANIRVTPTVLQQQPSTAKCFTVTPPSKNQIKSSYLVHCSRLLASHPGLAPSSLLLKGLRQQVAVATHPLIPKAHPGGAVHHLAPEHACLLLSIIAFLLRSHHGPVHATHHSSCSVLLLLHHVGLLLRREVLLLPLAHHLRRTLARRCLHVRQVLPHGAGASWATHDSLVPLLGRGGRP
ncbi:hypothetical protein EYF80_038408 [Liparis tanakae]|uniref:Uncharacterized protein n=1 Tax=Liparis tanakae TaxID=230148 RepID=A0A4Z2GDV1_9TELE|nr:hypothetical protein EYF80_038408 [Liparis tanakae]